MTAPYPFFRRGDQGVRSSGAVDSPDFQKNTCVRDGYYAFTHTKLRRAKYFASVTPPSGATRHLPPMGAGERLLAFTTACNGENSLAHIGGKRSSRTAARDRGIGGRGLEWDWRLYTMKIHIFIRRSNIIFYTVFLSRPSEVQN